MSASADQVPCKQTPIFVHNSRAPRPLAQEVYRLSECIQTSDCIKLADCWQLAGKMRTRLKLAASSERGFWIRVSAAVVQSITIRLITSTFDTSQRDISTSDL
jgi:hypothetical protein